MNKDLLYTFQEGSKNSYVNHGLRYQFEVSLKQGVEPYLTLFALLVLVCSA